MGKQFIDDRPLAPSESGDLKIAHVALSTTYAETHMTNQINLDVITLSPHKSILTAEKE